MASKRTRTLAQGGTSSSPSVGQIQQCRDKETLVEKVQARPQTSLAPPSPLLPPPFKLPHSFAWEKGVTKELSVAYFPPRRFLDVVIPLTEADEHLVHVV